MGSRAFHAITALLAAGAAAAFCAEPDTEITAAELMKRLPSMAIAAPAPPEVTEDEVIALEEDDPDTYIFINWAKARAPKPVNLGGDGRLRLVRPNTGEKITAVYRKKTGAYDMREVDRISRLMRCRLTGKHTRMSIKMLEILDAVEDNFGRGGLTVLSGYRTPALNKHTPGAARWSLHMLGWASDIRIPGQSAADIAAFSSRLKAGGVGYYPDAGFVHLDSGRTRHWEVRRRN